jgi:predicted transcriptional regulator
MPVWVSFKLDDATQKMFGEAANDRGVSVSTWLQQAVAEHVEAIEAHRIREQSALTPGEGA